MLYVYDFEIKFDFLRTIILPSCFKNNDLGHTHKPLLTWKLLRTSAWNERINIDTLRPLPIFLGITGPSFCFSPEAFNPPSKHWDKSTTEKIRLRLRLNLAYFLTNYVFILLGTTLVVTLTHPIMIMYLGILWLLWQIHKMISQHNIPLVLMGYDIGEYFGTESRRWILYGFTACVVIFHCLVPFLTVVVVSSFLILSHAVLRDPKQIDLQGGAKGALRHVVGRGTDHESDEDTECSEVMVNKSDLA